MFVFPLMWWEATKTHLLPHNTMKCLPLLLLTLLLRSGERCLNCFYPGHARMLSTHLTGLWVTWLFPQHSAPPLLLQSIWPSTLWTSTTSSVGILDPELLQGRSTWSTRSLSKDLCPSGDCLCSQIFIDLFNYFNVNYNNNNTIIVLLYCYYITIQSQ